MFHVVSQIAALVATPTNALVVLVVLGALAGLTPRLRIFGRRLSITAAIILSLLAATPIGDWLLMPLERRFSVFAPDGRPVAGIVVLGGSVSKAATSSGVAHAQPNQAADRLFEAARLAGLFPQARILVSGGPEDPQTHIAEADLMAGYLEKLGVAPTRLSRERLSQDTFENARFSAALAHPSPAERWVLVTSAFHMPRAIGSFRAAGFNIDAAPADWRVGPGGGPPSWSAAGNLQKVDLAVREYLGLAAYYLWGRTVTVFPGPSPKSDARASPR